MKKAVFVLFILILSINAQVKFEKYFHDKSLRVDYYHSGDKANEFFTFDEMKEEKYWGGSKVNLIDTFYYGNMFGKVIDLETGQLIYSRGYSTLYDEYVTTDESKKVKMTFEETFVMPFPRRKVRLELYSRDSENKFEKKFSLEIDPNDYFIKREKISNIETKKIHYSGDHSKKLDVVFLAEGFTKDQKEKFYKECERFKNYLINNKPFNMYKDKINVWAVFSVSEDEGADIPKDGVWKNTAMNFSYYTFNSERYLMTYDYKKVRDYASLVPYDQIYILVNSDKYGGGAIYNYYNVGITGNPAAEKVFLHEFGHGFGGLADEYYTDDVAYDEPFYNTKVEPWEPNITTLVEFNKKWKKLVDKDTPIPTPNTKEYQNKIGVFEGAGYMNKGVYRSTANSLMLSLKNQEFNEVSKRAIINLLKFYSE